MNPNDPIQLAVLIFLVAIVILGIYFAIREVIADGIILAGKKREAEEQNKRNRR